jgi:hypothetical protein
LLKFLEYVFSSLLISCHVYCTCNKKDLGTTGNAAADRHLPDGKQILTLRQAGRSKAWHVKMRHRRMIPEGGWHEFVGDNRLHAGDICLLEPVKNDRLAMAFHIIRIEQHG